ncbi:MAG: hypothetical protein IJA69_01200 [Clostridia bacterium]|nr:hypothetical protein [Clostridia bacterium]
MEEKITAEEEIKDLNNNQDETAQNQPEEDIEYSAEEYRDMFIRMRAKYDKKLIHKGSIEAEKILKEAYMETLELAVGGDVVAQDLLSYWLKHGNLALPENIELSMKWLMLAAAGGNKHSIDKLSMLFSFIYDTIAMSEEFEIFADYNALDEISCKHCLGQVICHYIVQTMPIDALELSKQKLTKIEFNSASMNIFTNAANKSVEPVLETIKKANEKAFNS